MLTNKEAVELTVTLHSMLMEDGFGNLGLYYTILSIAPKGTTDLEIDLIEIIFNEITPKTISLEGVEYFRNKLEKREDH